MSWPRRGKASLGLFVFLRARKEFLDTLFDASALRDLVHRLVLFVDVVVIFIIDVHVGSLDVSET
jgi:hypothetical protein